MHGQCDTRPGVTFPDIEKHSPIASTKLYCFVTEEYACKQSAYVIACNRNGWKLNLWVLQNEATYGIL